MKAFADWYCSRLPKAGAMISLNSLTVACQSIRVPFQSATDIPSHSRLSDMATLDHGTA